MKPDRLTNYGHILVASGRAVITDFGLARAYDDGHGAGSEHSAGAGSERYMAPELVAGERPTVLSDIFAFGRVAEGLRPRVRLWSRCTRANPEERPASMDEVRKSLESGHNRRYWIGGLVLTVAGGAAVWRSSIPQFLLAAGSRVLVNGFRADTDSESRARLARSVFVTALRQSPRIQTVSDPDLLPTLASIAPGAVLPADGDILRTLLHLHRAEYWIDARLERGTSRFSIVLQILRRADGLLVWEHAIRNIPGVVQLAELAAAEMRRAAGESDASLAANPAETTSYTSRVPEALESYHEAMLAVARNAIEAAVPLLETAIRLDPVFAQAHSTLGLCHYSMRRDEIGFRHVEKGWQLSSALPERERAAVESAYHSLSDDFEKAVEAARRAVSYFPGEPRYRRNLSQALCRMGSVEEGITEIRQAVTIVPNDDTIRNELIVELCEAGRFEEALNEYRLAVAGGGKAKEMARAAGLANLGLGRAAEALRVFESVDRPNPRLVRGAQIMMGSFEAAAAGLQQDLAASDRDRNPIQGHQVNEFLCGVYFLSDRTAPAATQVREMVNLPIVPSSGRFLQCTAFWAGRLAADGTLAATTQALEALEARWPNGPVRAAADYGRSQVQKRKGDLAACERLLLSSLGLSESVWGLFDAADLFAQTGRLALAEEYWKKFEARRGNVLKHWFPGLTLYGALLRGRAAAARGEFAVARLCANRILEHWASQNPGIGIVRAARQFLPPKAETKGR